MLCHRHEQLVKLHIIVISLGETMRYFNSKSSFGDILVYWMFDCWWLMLPPWEWIGPVGFPIYFCHRSGMSTQKRNCLSSRIRGRKWQWWNPFRKETVLVPELMLLKQLIDTTAKNAAKTALIFSELECLEELRLPPRDGWRWGTGSGGVAMPLLWRWCGLWKPAFPNCASSCPSFSDLTFNGDKSPIPLYQSIRRQFLDGSTTKLTTCFLGSKVVLGFELGTISKVISSESPFSSYPPWPFCSRFPCHFRPFQL